MNMTVYQFKKALDEMRTVYNFEDDETYIGTQDLKSREHNCISLQTKDKQTGIRICMEKQIGINEYRGVDPLTGETISKEDYE